jgi:hypothetical protein
LLDYVAGLKFLFSGKPADAMAIVKAHYHVVKDLGKTRAKRKLLAHYPVIDRNIYKGIVLWDYFILKRKRIKI